MAVPLFSVSEFTTWSLTFEEDVRLYSELGIQGIEVCERKLSPEPSKALDQLRCIKEHNLKVTSVQPRCHALFADSMYPECADPDERAKLYSSTIDLFSAAFLGENIPLVAISGNAPGLNHRHAHETARRIYPALATYAADHGMRIMFEPLNPIIMNADAFICSLNEGIRLVEDVGQENFGLMIDAWHIWREPFIFERLKDLDPSFIFGVHVSDWPIGEPRLIGDRLLPGDGIIDLPRFLGALDHTGYQGAYCLEIFSDMSLDDSLWQRDPREVLHRGQRGFVRAWEQRICC